MDARESFFRPQLKLLYDEIYVKQHYGHSTEPESLENWYCDFFKRIVTTRTATLPCVFLFICWAHSVAVLQGDGVLRHTIGLSIMRCWSVEERLKENMVHPCIPAALKSKPTAASHDLPRVNEATAVLQANPLLAGCVEIDHVFACHYYGTLASFTTGQLKPVAHCYQALLGCELIDAIPIVDGIVQLYENTIFKLPRRPNKRGSFVETFLKSITKELAIQSSLHPRLKFRRPKTEMDLDKCSFETVSRVFRLINNRDSSGLPAQSMASGSWKVLLSAVSDVCNAELFGTRVLARDVLKITNEITDAYHAVCDVVKPLFDDDGEMMRVMQEHLSPEDSVILPFLRMLDNPGSKAAFRGRSSSEIDSICRQVADVVPRQFPQRRPEDVDATFYLFPSTRESVAMKRREGVSSVSEETNATFEGLMEMLESSEGPLGEDQFARLKAAVRKDPALLYVKAANKTNELCTLIHHAAAGPAHDRRLLKWLVQEISSHEASLISFEVSDHGSMGTETVNMTPLHCAAQAGFVDMVRLLLEAGLMRDLNTVTGHTRESLAHLAVKHGNRELFTYLVSVHADLWRPDAAGNNVHELTADRQWQEEILSVPRLAHQPAAEESDRSSSKVDTARRLWRDPISRWRSTATRCGLH